MFRNYKLFIILYCLSKKIFKPEKCCKLSDNDSEKQIYYKPNIFFNHNPIKILYQKYLYNQ